MKKIIAFIAVVGIFFAGPLSGGHSNTVNVLDEADVPMDLPFNG